MIAPEGLNIGSRNFFINHKIQIDKRTFMGVNQMKTTPSSPLTYNQ